jgi:hypothetical protein
MPKHYIRFGTHTEKHFFYESPYNDLYDGIFINGNMLAYTPDSIVGFLLQIDGDKRIIIDPQTHAFQHNCELIKNKKGDGVKSSLESLAKLYGDSVLLNLTNLQPITPNYFSNQASIEDFCQKVGQFQIEKVAEVTNGREEKKYIDFAKAANAIKEECKIKDIVAPYFYIDSVDSPWIDINISLINETKNVFSKINNINSVLAQIVLSQQVLNDGRLGEIIEKYKSSNCDEYLIWVDGFSEDEQSVSSLKNFILLVTELASTSKRVTNLYGGYLSIILTKFSNGLSAVSHGLEYGESRGVVPVGGGLPMAKYYFLPLHRRLKQAVFTDLIIENGWRTGALNVYFEANICNCSSCKEVEKFFDSYPIKRGGRTYYYPTTKAKEHSLKHYLHCKEKEFKQIELEVIEIILSKLKDTYDTYHNKLAENEIIHLLNWKTAVEESINENILK